jgi:hypothetical protein
MTHRCCPVPNCIKPLCPGPHAVFCADHHWLLPRRVTSQIFGLEITCSRCEEPDTRQHLREQADAYIRIAVRTLTGEAQHVS